MKLLRLTSEVALLIFVMNAKNLNHEHQHK